MGLREICANITERHLKEGLAPMPLVRLLKQAVSFITYLLSGDPLDASEHPGVDRAKATRRLTRTGARLRWVLAKENLAEDTPSPDEVSRRTWLTWMFEAEPLPEEEAPPDARPATRGIWFLESEPFPSDLPEKPSRSGFWSWLFSRDRDTPST